MAPHSNCRRKTLFRQLRLYLVGLLLNLATYKECRIEEGQLIGDHVQIFISIPPKYTVSQLVGCIRDKNAKYLGERMVRGAVILWCIVFGARAVLSRTWEVITRQKTNARIRLYGVAAHYGVSQLTLEPC